MLYYSLNKIDTNSKNFYEYLLKILNIKQEKIFKRVEYYIKNIIYNIKKFKEKSIIFYIKKFEKNMIKNIEDIRLKNNDLEREYFKLDTDLKFILESSKNRILMYHEEQIKNINKNWKVVEETGSVLGQKRNTIDSVGFYIPGGKANYPSSVFMNTTPAIIAGVENIITCSPLKSNNSSVLAALYISGVKNVYSIGGVQAITSMAFGNRVIKPVNKICGPGNIYVTLTKKLLYGIIGIDLIAGPSELTIIADKESDKHNVVMDIFSQAEHDNLAQSILISFEENFLLDIENKIRELTPFLYRKKIIYNSILNNIILIKANNLNEAFNLLNVISPEHLIIYLKSNYEFFKNIKNSGSNFLGDMTSESFGDYNAGLNHIIPTNKNCSFSSPLGTYSFTKYLNFLKLNLSTFNKLSKTCLSFSNEEKLYAHLNSVKFRIQG